MALLPYIEPEAADPITRQVYDKTVARFQMVLNIFKITGNAPEIAEKMWEIFFEILQDGQIPWATKELLILKATHMGDCLYCVTQHEAVLKHLVSSRSGLKTMAKAGAAPEILQDIIALVYATLGW